MTIAVRFANFVGSVIQCVSEWVAAGFNATIPKDTQSPTARTRKPVKRKSPALDLVLHGGRVITLDPRSSIAEAIAAAGVLADNLVRARAWPYTGWAGFAYDTGLPREQLRDVLVAAARHDVRVGGIQPGLLDLYGEVDRIALVRDKRWVLEHISVRSDDEVHRIRDLGLVVTTHTNSYIAKQGEILRRRVGPDAEDTIAPSQRLTREEALRAATAAGSSSSARGSAAPSRRSAACRPAAAHPRS